MVFQYTLQCAATLFETWQFFITFQILVWVILPQTYPRIPFLATTYASLSPIKQREVCGTTCSLFHACSAVLLSFYAVLFENQLEIESLTGNSMAIMLQLRITGGYFLSDTLVLLSYPKGYLLAIDDKKDDPPQGRPFHFIAHHLVCLIVIALGLHSKVGIWFFAWRLVTEVPNIFLNFWAILDLYKLEKSKLFQRVNDVVFFTFVLVRPYAVFRFWKGTFSVMKTADFWALGQAVTMSWLFSAAVLDFLNVTWLIEVFKDFIGRNFASKKKR